MVDTLTIFIIIYSVSSGISGLISLIFSIRKIMNKRRLSKTDPSLVADSEYSEILELKKQRKDIEDSLKKIQQKATRNKLKIVRADLLQQMAQTTEPEQKKILSDTYANLKDESWLSKNSGNIISAVIGGSVTLIVTLLTIFLTK